MSTPPSVAFVVLHFVHEQIVEEQVVWGTSNLHSYLLSDLIVVLFGLCN
jgi:hypothetical protein